MPNHLNQDGCKKVLLVDPDGAFASVLQRVLGEAYSLRHATNPEAALRSLRDDGIDVVLLNWDDRDLALGGAGRLMFLQHAFDKSEAPPVIALSWDTRRETAIEALRQGVSDFFSQPLSVLELRFAIQRACVRMSLARDLAAAKQVIATKCVEGLLGNSKQMEAVRELIHKLSNVQTTVLITGESGTGKEVAARAIHRLSPRAQQPFVAFSACALPESLIEDELFGHEKGSFTGAVAGRKGRFEESNGGTIFLDEIGDLALPLQSKLLRVLQERSLERIGSNAPVPLNVRVICATNRDLAEMVKEGTFRQDLYFRISVVKVHLPSLRQRMEDIPLLAEYFLKTFASVHNKGRMGFGLGCMSAMAAYSWPGNVRELQNVIEHSVVMADGSRIGLTDLPTELRRLAVASTSINGPFQDAVQSFKREIIRSALHLHDGNKVQAAKELRISRCYLHRLLKQLNIEEETGGWEENDSAAQSGQEAAVLSPKVQ